MAIHVLFHQCLTNPHTPPSISEREISVRPAWLCALVGFFCFVMLVPGLLVAQTEFAGDVSGVWDPGGNPYIQVGEANVPEEQALTILPGVEVILLPDSELSVNGRLTAVGALGDTIRFHPPEGEFGGTIRLFSTVDTLNFIYCRFDDLEHVLWVVDETKFRVRNCFFYDNNYGVLSMPRWAEITHSTIMCISRDGELFRGQIGIFENSDVTFSDNFLLGRFNLKVQCERVVVERNTTEAIEINDFVETVALNFKDCQHVVIRGNQNSIISVVQVNAGLIDAIIENNVAPDKPFSIMGSGNAEVICRRNKCRDLTFQGGRNVELNGNLTGGYIFIDDCQATLNYNFGLISMVGSNNVLTITNCTIARDHPVDDLVTAPISFRDPENRYEGNRVILHNNLIYGHNQFPFAVAEGVEVEGLGYNHIWNVEQAYAERDDLLRDDVVNENPRLREGVPFDYRLRADSPCIDGGDPDSPVDPDGTRADIGNYFFDQENGEPPALNKKWDFYIGWNETFRYAAVAVDEGEELQIVIEGLPEWLEIEEEELGRDFVRDSLVVSGVVPEDQEDFVFHVIAQDDAEREDTLSVRVMVYPYRVLTGIVRGVLDVEQSPFIVADTAWIPEGDSLVLPSGATLYFDNREDTLSGRKRSKLWVKGVLRAIGTPEDSIFFDVLEEEENRAHPSVHWDSNPDGQSLFQYCHFRSFGKDISSNDCNIDYNNTFSDGDPSGLFVRSVSIPFDFHNNRGNANGTLSGTGCPGSAGFGVLDYVC